MSTIAYMEVLASGEIISVGHCQNITFPEVSPLFGGEIVLLDVAFAYQVNGREHYLSGETIMLRPEIASPGNTIVADGVDALVFPFPNGTTFTLDEAAYEVDDDEGLTFTTDTPGKILLRAKPPFPHKPFEQEIVANAP